ncbi:hypothetical protein ACO0LC_21855 [Undibacterium sp. JH2W]|uniref:hypothetical protein n=1 Tax=Undibacterium sp. JH2W TaxID=3413037 RepID=UPI003BF10D7F
MLTQGRSNAGVDFDVSVDFDFPQFPCVDAFDAKQKMEKERPMSERSEFSGFPIFCFAAKGTPFRGQRRLGRLFGPPFWRSKKVGSRRSTTGLQS